MAQNDYERVVLGRPTEWVSQWSFRAPGQTRCSQGSAILETSAGRRASGAIVHESLASIGIDSLVGIELQAAIGVKLGVQVSLLELMRGENLVGMAAQLLKAMRIPSLPGAGAEATGAERGDARARPPRRDIVRPDRGGATPSPAESGR